MVRMLTILALLLSAGPLAAAETAWQDVAPGVRVRLIASNVLTPDGKTHAALEIDMPPSVKTYWRIPGETGIPTEVDWSGSRGIGSGRVVWPFPTRDDAEGYVDYVYYGPTVLPMELAVDEAQAMLSASVLMGICSDICMPVTVGFELPLDFAAADRGQGLRIRQALAASPVGWDGAEPAIAAVSLAPDARALQVRIADPEVDASSLIAAVDDGEALFGPPQKSPEPDLVVLPFLGKGPIKGLEGKPVHLTFMTHRGPFEQSLTISLADAPFGGNK